MELSNFGESTEFVIADEKQAFAQDPIAAASVLGAANFPESTKVVPPSKLATKARRNLAFKQFLARKKELKAQKRQFAEMNPEESAAMTKNPAKRKKIAQIFNDQTKTALQKMNELGLKFTMSCESVPSSNLFKAIITMDDQTFENVSSSKQDARQKVAAQVLQNVGASQDFAVEMAQPDEDDKQSLAKTPVQIINELFIPNTPNWPVEGQQLATGGPFTATLSLGNYGDFTGNGRSKKEARHSAALAAVLKIFDLPTLQGYSMEYIRMRIQQFRVSGAVAASSPALPNDVAPMATNGNAQPVAPPQQQKPAVVPEPQAAVQTTVSPSPTVTSNKVTKSHLQVLNERFGPNKVNFAFVGEDGPPNRKVFTVSLKVEGVTDEFVATGSSKQEAKQNAAAMVITTLNIDEPALATVSPGAPISDTSKHNAWSDFVASMILNKFASLTQGTEWSRRTVLAGVVMTAGDNFQETAQPIAIATGTKCLSANKMSMTGCALLDCHAEVLCRRAVCRYLYSHLLAMSDEKLASDAVFEPRPDGQPGYRIKEGFRFHLFISTAPCGDSRVFCPVDDEKVLAGAANSDKHPNRVNRGILRNKLENGEGTAPSIEQVSALQVPQTWDGIMGGDRLVIVSCSDKILAWNHLGIQGNLLSHFIEPIYLSSIIIASAFNADHLQRALLNRFPTQTDAESKFQLHQPTILSTSRPEQRMPCKPPKHAFLWTVCDRAFEVIDGASGRLLDTGYPSSVCKLTLFRLFSAVEGKVSSKIVQTDSDSPMSSLTYRDAKKRNDGYADAKEAMVKSLLDNFLGYWPIKPPEIDGFILPADNKVDDLKSEAK